MTPLLSFRQSHTRSAPPYTVYVVCCALLYLDSSNIQPSLLETGFSDL
jgi:hypothetical protein